MVGRVFRHLALASVPFHPDSPKAFAVTESQSQGTVPFLYKLMSVDKAGIKALVMILLEENERLFPTLYHHSF